MDLLPVTRSGDTRGGPQADAYDVDAFERLLVDVYDEGVVTEVIRPAAIVHEEVARLVVGELALRDVRAGGNWRATPTLWQRYEREAQPGEDTPPETELIGTIQVAYGTPTRYDITIYRATITRLGQDHGWDVTKLCDEALSFGGLDLATCPRASLVPPPRPFRY